MMDKARAPRDMIAASMLCYDIIDKHKADIVLVDT